MNDPQVVIARLRQAIGSVYFGPEKTIDRVIVCLLARGHLLIEDVPGVGKTVLATTLARSVDCTFSRIQMTPDLLPSDVLGVSIFNRETGGFEFRPGPIFANIVLADEVNRTSPRTQSALLEAMNDGSVSVDGVTRKLDQPFMIVATQNPFEFEGTFPLPENQLDRFLMRVRLGYPAPEDEARVLEHRPGVTTLPTLSPAITRGDLLALQSLADAVKVDSAIVRYIVAIANATRTSAEFELGLSPRASLSLQRAARAQALVSGRTYVTPEDVLEHLEPVCAHRVLLKRGSIDPSTRQVVDALQAVVRSVQSPL
jgi:MoxR-like ATPase